MPRPKHLLFLAFGLMTIFVLWNNERFLIDPSSEAWVRYDPIRLHLIPHGIGGALALGLGATQFSSRLRRKRLPVHRFLGKLYILGCFVLAAVAILIAFRISPWFDVANGLRSGAQPLIVPTTFRDSEVQAPELGRRRTATSKSDDRDDLFQPDKIGRVASVER